MWQKLAACPSTRMGEVRPAFNGDAAAWLLETHVDWWDLVRYGPPGFDVYLRIALDPRPPPDRHDQDSSMRLTLATLAAHTSTPKIGYAAVWEGGGGGPPPDAPRVLIPHRGMLLFTGPVETLRDAPSLAWYGHVQARQEPNLVWPSDRAWCLACEVDEEVEFGVGCSFDAFAALTSALPAAVRRVGYGYPAPLYRS